MNARNLLYLQAELTDLENALLQAEERDSKHLKWEKQAHTKDWYWIAHSVQADDEDKLQYYLWMKIREKLNEYNEALRIQACIHEPEEPDDFDIADLQNFLSCDQMRLPLIGADRDTWSICNDGLVTLRPRESTDAFTNVLSKYVVEVLDLINRIFSG
ncbi:hypothetical protein CC86DRAFT_462710 [Ophiobolus disseminans]|uniref:DUF6594 domain-containing protein n=1 Tax=Ophiobolus disseminans TaxID=1469910 RepID=A0A6A7AI90_9PLEO|nr:hypothetical protein CC86DRAFT_462710 [Ophiobolus disseminans]